MLLLQVTTEKNISTNSVFSVSIDLTSALFEDFSISSIDFEEACVSILLFYGIE